MRIQEAVAKLAPINIVLESVEELGADEVNAMTLGQLRVELLKRDVLVTDTIDSIDRLIIEMGRGEAA